MRVCLNSYGCLFFVLTEVGVHEHACLLNMYCVRCFKPKVTNFSKPYNMNWKISACPFHLADETGFNSSVFLCLHILTVLFIRHRILRPSAPLQVYIYSTPAKFILM